MGPGPFVTTLLNAAFSGHQTIGQLYQKTDKSELKAEIYKLLDTDNLDSESAAQFFGAAVYFDVKKFSQQLGQVYEITAQQIVKFSSLAPREGNCSTNPKPIVDIEEISLPELKKGCNSCPTTSQCGVTTEVFRLQIHTVTESTNQQESKPTSEESLIQIQPKQTSQKPQGSVLEQSFPWIKLVNK